MNRREAQIEALWRAGALIEDSVSSGVVSDMTGLSDDDAAMVEAEMSKIASKLFDNWYRLGGRS